MRGAFRATRDMATMLLVLVVVSDVFYAVENGLVGWTLLGKVATAGALIWLLHQALRSRAADGEAGRRPPRT